MKKSKKETRSYNSYNDLRSLSRALQKTIRRFCAEEKILYYDNRT